MRDFSLIIPVGPPGAGKSTMATALTHGCITDHMIVSPDHYRFILTGDRSDQNSNKEVFSVVDTIIKSRIRHRLTTYVDATNLTSFREIARWGDQYGATIYTIRFDVSLMELQKRNKNRFHPVPDDVLERMTDAFYDIPMDQFRGTVLSPEQAVALAHAGGFAHQKEPNG